MCVHGSSYPQGLQAPEVNSGDSPSPYKRGRIEELRYLFNEGLGVVEYLDLKIKTLQ